MAKMNITVVSTKHERQHEERLKTAKPNSIAVKRPDLLSEWDWEKNEEAGLDPYQLAATADTKSWWKCQNHPHSYYVRTRNKTYNNQGCAVCAGRQIIVGYNDLAFLEPEIAAEWDYELNDRTPEEVTIGSHYMAHWICSIHGTKWSAEVKSRVSFKTGCPDCKSGKISKNNVKPKPGGKYLAEEFPEIAKEWCYELNGDRTPENVASRSGKEFYFVCSECGNIYPSLLCNRTRLGEGCPDCGLRRTGDINATPKPGESLLDLYPEIAAQWDYDKNVGIGPGDIKPWSQREYWWKGIYCDHTWKGTANARMSSKGNCPICARGQKMSFPEKAIYHYVRIVFLDAVENSNGPNKCLGRCSVDVWIPSISTAIEYDGEHWHRDAERDFRKDEICEKNGIRLIRVREPGCAIYDSTATFINRESTCGYSSLNKAISDVFKAMGTALHPDIDTQKDERLIRNLISLPTSEVDVFEQLQLFDYDV